MFGVFKDRKEAAGKLAEALKKYKNSKDVIILGLLRGGIVPAFEVAKELNLSLDFVVLRKIGAPGNQELAIGTITEDDMTIFDSEMILGYNIQQKYIDKTIAEEKKEIERRIKLYRQDYPKKDLKNKMAIIIDDGVATGSTVRAAAKTARFRGAEKVIIAVPVCPTHALTTLQSDADEVICIHPSDMLFAIGAFYDDFPQVEDKEVLEILKKAHS